MGEQKELHSRSNMKCGEYWLKELNIEFFLSSGYRLPSSVLHRLPSLFTLAFKIFFRIYKK